jgi:hypothetical protein
MYFTSVRSFAAYANGSSSIQILQCITTGAKRILTVEMKFLHELAGCVGEGEQRSASTRDKFKGFDRNAKNTEMVNWGCVFVTRMQEGILSVVIEGLLEVAESSTWKS